MLKTRGPLLIACNHPNSFLDSVILDILFHEPVWSLARGDAFLNKRISSILHSLKILPVYRTTEGVENLSENYKTFDDCVAIFRSRGIVQIFSEGKCVNEWRLRRLKKGTARLAVQAWEENIPLRVLPVGINYSSYRRFGKNIFLNFGNMITRDHIRWNEGDGIRHQSFNQVLDGELRKLVMEIPKSDRALQKQRLEIRPSANKKILLAIPAFIGWILHAPMYLPIKWITMNRAGKSDHYDSIITALLIISYPFYLLLLTGIIWSVTGDWKSIFLLLIAPCCAWAYTQLKGQLDKQ